MKIRIKIISVALLTLFVFSSLFLMNADSAFGLSIYIKSYILDVVSDEHGGAFIAVRDDPHTCLIQRLDSSGNCMWEGSGTITPYTASIDKIAYDGQGGVIRVWGGETNGAQGLYAQRIDGAGNLMWDSSGVLAHKRTGGELPGWLEDLSVVPDKDGGAIIIWQRLEYPNPVYAQRIDATGNIVWDLNGILVAQNLFYYGLNSVSDGTGGAIIIWQQEMGSAIGTYTQRIDEDGNLLWGSGVLIGDDYYNYKMISDKNGGAIIVFDDYHDISFVHINSSGEKYQVENNQIHSESSIYDVEIIANGYGGAYIIWTQEYSGTSNFRYDTDIYATHIDDSGNFVWEKGLLEICTLRGPQSYPKLIKDSSGGFIVAWQDFRNDSRCIYAQRVDAYGNILWAKDGVNLGRYYYPFRDFEMVSNGSGGAIIIREEGESLEPKIFSQVVGNDGAFTEPETSLYPQGLPRDKRDYEPIGSYIDNRSQDLPRYKQDYEAVVGPIIVDNRPRNLVWVWLLPAGIIIAIGITFFIIKRLRKNRNSDKV